jgi:hypothetical protein
MPRYITRATPRCITFSIRSIIGQGWTPPLKQSARPALSKCIRANRRRKKLNLDFDPASQKDLLLPRQQYGIDFYGVHNGEILIMVDLFSRETMLEFLPNSFVPFVSRVAPARHQKGIALQVGEMIIMLD